eukprot:328325-Chlamydomonas_euryale.AAC.2
MELESTISTEQFMFKHVKAQHAQRHFSGSRRAASRLCRRLPRPCTAAARTAPAAAVSVHPATKRLEIGKANGHGPALRGRGGRGRRRAAGQLCRTPLQHAIQTRLVERDAQLLNLHNNLSGPCLGAGQGRNAAGGFLPQTSFAADLLCLYKRGLSGGGGGGGREGHTQTDGVNTVEVASPDRTYASVCAAFRAAS